MKTGWHGGPGTRLESNTPDNLLIIATDLQTQCTAALFLFPAVLFPSTHLTELDDNSPIAHREGEASGSAKGSHTLISHLLGLGQEEGRGLALAEVLPHAGLWAPFLYTRYRN